MRYGSSTSQIVSQSCFHRYLTKIADQIIVLISDEHADCLTLATQSAFTDGDEEDAGDRMFAFEVAKTLEEDENVTASPGFRVYQLYCLTCDADHGLQTSFVCNESNRYVPQHPDVTIDGLSPRLVSGDTCIGLMSTSYKPARPVVTEMPYTIYSATRLRGTLYVLKHRFVRYRD